MRGLNPQTPLWLRHWFLVKATLNDCGRNYVGQCVGAAGDRCPNECRQDMPVNAMDDAETILMRGERDGILSTAVVHAWHAALSVDCCHCSM